MKFEFNKIAWKCVVISTVAMIITGFLAGVIMKENLTDAVKISLLYSIPFPVIALVISFEWE